MATLLNKMKVLYISPAKIPSDKANSIHVINQCLAFFESEISIELITVRKIFRKNLFYKNLDKNYGINNYKFYNSIKSLYYPFNFGSSFIISIFSLYYMFVYKKQKYIISRNLYSAYFASILSITKFIYETHQIEKGIKGLLQKSILKTNMKKILISEKLKLFLELNFNLKLKNYLILHDAAPFNPKKLDVNERKKIIAKYLKNYEKWNLKIGYFGSLYDGRGIDLISKIAKKNKNNYFLIFGKKTIRHHDESNIKFYGRVGHIEALKIMQAVDILLMPYQKKVSIGQKNHDTSGWMSPLKMFEYMSSNTAIISSNHDVLKEVLNTNNAILCDYNNKDDWIKAIEKLENDKNFAKKISENAYKDFIENYTWNKRAKKIIKFFVEQ